MALTGGDGPKRKRKTNNVDDKFKVAKKTKKKPKKTRKA